MNLEGKYVTVTTQEECDAVQKKAFELGYIWRENKRKMLVFFKAQYPVNLYFKDMTLTWMPENIPVKGHINIDTQTFLSL